MIVISHAVAGQIYLQLEKRGRARTLKFTVGQQLTWQEHHEKEWHTAKLVRIIPQDRLLVFDDRYVPLDRIAALRSFKGARWSKATAYQLYLFGVSWSVYALIADIFDPTDPYTKGDLAVTATAGVTGYLLYRLFRSRTYRVGRKWKLRIVDLRVKAQSS